MPWVRLDDRFTSHRKIRLLSHQAFRLYVSGLCYAAENLTDGRIPAEELRIVADIKTSKAAAKELVERGLWEVHEEGGWQIHDYLEYNPAAEQVRAERQAKTARQQRWRENKKKQRPGKGTPGVDGSVDASTDASRDGGVTPAPYPSPNPVPPTEELPPYPPHAGDHLPAVHGGGQEAAAVGPDWLQPLTGAMGAASMHVPWKFKGDDLIRLHNDIKRLGIPLMVEQARRSWQSARTPVVSSRFFYDSWHAMPTPEPAPDGRPNLRAVDGPSETNEYLEDMAAIADEFRQRKMGGA
ncbi:hypothetical protein [Streptomyces sp. sk2.1]|uniref:hypothetical protein n=1 Tax=Streptomyces sp. sk2.1 TaxID=2478959 RepID=UPI0011E73968|nr:hypothetical protein [Streptomyces sp. sk2.1]